MVHTEMGKQNSRTIPGLFSFFKDSISSQFCIKQQEKNALFSAGNVEVENRKKAHSFSLILMIKTGTTTQIE